MITDFSNITTSIVKLALNASSMQHNLIATNIANVNTDQYNSSHVDFSRIYDEVNKVMSMSGANKMPQVAEIKNMLSSGHFVSTQEVEGVEIDSELIGLSKNTVMYKTLLSALSSRGELMQIAINGERR